jgi:hypothetical protein
MDWWTAQKNGYNKGLQNIYEIIFHVQEWSIEH